MTATVRQFEKHVIIPADRRISINLPSDVPEGSCIVIELPEEVPVGGAEIVLSICPKRDSVNRVGELYGAGKGEKVWMSDDFNEPLEDFKDYM